MSAASVGGAPQRLVGRMRALRKNRKAERSELRNCQPRSQALGLKQEEGKDWEEERQVRGKEAGGENSRKEAARHTSREANDGGDEDRERENYESQKIQIKRKRRKCQEEHPSGEMKRMKVLCCRAVLCFSGRKFSCCF